MLYKSLKTTVPCSLNIANVKSANSERVHLQDLLGKQRRRGVGGVGGLEPAVPILADIFNYASPCWGRGFEFERCSRTKPKQIAHDC